jgi:carboxyl-terminal processing protease
MTLLQAGFLIASMLIAASAAQSQTKQAAKPAEVSTLTPQQRQRNLESFEVVWRTVRDKHWDPKLGGLNWQAVHDELRPRMEKATTAAQGRAVLNDMLGRLHQTHFGIIPEEAYREMSKGPAKSTPGKGGKGEEKAAAGKGGEKPGSASADSSESAADRAVPGFAIRVVDGRALVVQVDEGLPAAKLGVRTGWQVVQIGGEDLAPAIATIRKTYKNSTLLDLQLFSAIMGRMHGKLGNKLTIVFHNGDDREVSLPIPLAEPAGAPVHFGNLPTWYVHVEARKLPGNVGYFALNAFFDPVRVVKAFQETIQGNLSASGFILDLRGNPGGIGAMAMGFGNWFVSAPDQKLGTLSTRDTNLNFVLNPRVETFNGPLAILVDGCSASTSEILVGGLHDIKRAKLFGSRTAGAALPSLIVRLPNGDGFQFAFANYISAGGAALEGKGVRPDVEVPLQRQALLRGEDVVLDAALRWIGSQKKVSQ